MLTNKNQQTLHTFNAITAQIHKHRKRIIRDRARYCSILLIYYGKFTNQRLKKFEIKYNIRACRLFIAYNASERETLHAHIIQDN